MPGGPNVTPPRWAGAPTSAAPPPSSSASSSTSAQEQSADGQRVRGTAELRFGYQNVTTSLSADKMYTAWPGAAATLIQAGEVMLFRGDILGITLRSNARKSAGTARFEIYVNDAASGAFLDWSDNELRDVARFASGRYSFPAEAELDVRITTSSAFAPTTVDLGVIVFVSQTAREAQPA